MNPYIGAQVALPGGDTGEYIDLTYGLAVGIKFYPWEHGGFNFGLAYNMAQVEGDADDLTDLGLFAGILIKF